MDCKSLMIDDLALIDGVARKVCAITRHKVGYHLCERESTMHYARLHDVNPIPLTAENLEKNGWVRNNYIANGYRYPSRETFDLIIDDKRGIYMIGDCLFVTCMYAHELQQALRVDGNEDLANNLKV